MCYGILIVVEPHGLLSLFISSPPKDGANQYTLIHNIPKPLERDGGLRIPRCLSNILVKFVNLSRYYYGSDVVIH